MMVAPPAPSLTLYAAALNCTTAVPPAPPSVTATQGENSEVFAARGTEGISSLAKVVTLPMVALGGKTMVKVKATLPSLSVRTDRWFCVSRLLVGWFGEGVGLGGVGGALVQSEVR